MTQDGLGRFGRGAEAEDVAEAEERRTEDGWRRTEDR